MSKKTTTTTTTTKLKGAMSVPLPHRNTFATLPHPPTMTALARPLLLFLPLLLLLLLLLVVLVVVANLMMMAI